MKITACLAKPEPFCVGLCGQKQVGKDTIAKTLIPALSKNLNKDFTHVAFADAVKNTLCMFYYLNEETNEPIRVSRQFIEDNKENTKYFPKGWKGNVRWALCNIGDRFREINPEIWIDIALLNNKKDKVITDVRYPNEVIKIHNNTKGLVVKIIRPEFEKSNGHRSETSMLELDKYLPQNYEGPLLDNRISYDFLLRNDGSKEDLKIKVNTRLVPYILNKWKYFNHPETV